MKKRPRVDMPSKAACVILEYLGGGNLKSYLRDHREKKIPFKTVINLALDLARGYANLVCFFKTIQIQIGTSMIWLATNQNSSND